MHLRRVAVWLSVLAGLALPAQAQEYTFAVVPQAAASKSAQAWAPLLALVSKEAGVKLKFASAITITEFENRLVNSEKADFAWANPMTYAVAADKHGYTAFAREAKSKLQGIVVVAAGSPLRRLEDLRGKKLAVPEGAFAAETLVLADLAKVGIRRGTDLEVKAVNSHDSAYGMVQSGLVDAAGGVTRTFKKLAEDSQRKLRVLHTTEAFTPHPFFAHSRVPAEVVKRVREALLKVGGDPANAALMSELKFADGFEGARDGDYADVRKVEAYFAAPSKPDGGK